MSGALTEVLPAKGSTVKIELQQNKTCRIVSVGGKSARVFDGFKFRNGRLELPTRIREAECVLVIEEDSSHGHARLKGRIEWRGRPKEVKPLPSPEMMGTWGAEADLGGGGAGWPQMASK